MFVSIVKYNIDGCCQPVELSLPQGERSRSRDNEEWSTDVRKYGCREKNGLNYSILYNRYTIDKLIN